MTELAFIIGLVGMITAYIIGRIDGSNHGTFLKKPKVK